MPLLPTVPLTSQNSLLPPFGTDNIKLLFATDKNSFNLANVSVYMLTGAQSTKSCQIRESMYVTASDPGTGRHLLCVQFVRSLQSN
jgi:hypothetical protein